MIGRRALFFLVATLACVALVPATPADLRWVNWVTAGIGGTWTILLALEDVIGTRSGRRPRHKRPQSLTRSEVGTPFAPPPPPGAGATSTH